MSVPKCESDNRRGIKFGEVSGAKLEYGCIALTRKIHRGQNFLNRFSCNLSFPKTIQQLTLVNRILPIKLRAVKNKSHDPIISKGGANGVVWIIFN
jgi:hypothetical protein